MGIPISQLSQSIPKKAIDAEIINRNTESGPVLAVNRSYYKCPESVDHVDSRICVPGEQMYG
jgi:hypothetical protein